MNEPPQTAPPDGQANANAPPTISLPKGGGAIRGIGEKFAANPVTGTGSSSVPIYTSPGRTGFGPQFSLSYDSGSGNGPFGMGWSLSLPSITRKTDKGLPKYHDDQESDVFMLAGSEDLVPVLAQSAGKWQSVSITRTIDGIDYRVQYYRPRIEGLFARIERWTNVETGVIHWRSITKDNLTTIYGKNANSIITDPADPDLPNPKRIFTWLISETYDDRGNAVVYEYKAENTEGVERSQASEQNRTDRGRSANRYLKRVKYGNRVSRLIEPDLSHAQWMFEVVFDYGEHDDEAPSPNDAGPWLCRNDPFSTYRGGFEVRTYRLCQRVLMFHHFPAEDGVGQDCLVRSTDFVYQSTRNNPDDLKRGNPIASFISSATQSGYRRAASGYLKRSMPPLEFEYSQPIIQEEIQEIDDKSLENLPAGLDGSQYQWVDLDGEGLSGILSEQADGWFYKRNLSPISIQRNNGKETLVARFAPVELASTHPSPTSLGRGGQQFMDLAGDGQLDLVQFGGPLAGFYERDEEGGWTAFTPFTSNLEINWDDANLKFVDLTGDGHADIIVSEDNVFTWYPSLAEEGFGASKRVWQAFDEEQGPSLVFADGTQSIYLADMSGDGLTDLARIRNGEVCYWPNLGYGRFGAKVSMNKAPLLDRPELFDQRRIRLADIDGSGVTDLVYLASDGVHIYFNESGNGWSDAHELNQFPPIDSIASVTTIDLLGNGTACLVWSCSLPGASRRTMRYIDLMGGQKPHLLVGMKNNMGVETVMRYAPSTRFYLEDKYGGRPWVTKLPFPVHVVERIETIDRISRNRFVSRYAYHHGYFDGPEREFRGFGMVEQWDTEEFATLNSSDSLPEATNIDAASHVPPVLTRTWFHTGAWLDGALITKQFAHEYYNEGDASLGESELTQEQLNAMLLDDTVLPDSVTLEDGSRFAYEPSIDELTESVRSLKGSVLRQEIYALDGGAQSDRPYKVSERNYTIEFLQPRAGNRYAVFMRHSRETVDFHYERALYDVGNRQLADPRVAHNLTLEVDGFGNVLTTASVAYGRRHDDANPIMTAADHLKQKQTLVTCTRKHYTNPVDEADAYRAPLLCETRAYQLYNLEPNAQQPDVTNFFRFTEITAAIDSVSDGLHDVAYEDLDAAGMPGVTCRRPVEHTRVLYRRDDLVGPLPSGVIESRGLAFDTYSLAFTPDILSSGYQRTLQNQPPENLLPNAAAVLANEGGYVDLDGDGHWWIPSGRTFYHPVQSATPSEELDHAREHFFLTTRYQDALGNTTIVAYDTDASDTAYDLLAASVRDPVGNEVSAKYDYRVLQPNMLIDANGNGRAAAYDALGLISGIAVMGKEGENVGDSLDGFEADLAEATILAHLSDPLTDPHAILSNATTRTVCDLHRYERTSASANPQPNVVYTLTRETYASELAPGELSKVQHSFSYSDGSGREIQHKIQAEPGPVAAGPTVSDRWVGNGWTIFNNKNLPVRKYEPFFSATHEFEFAKQKGVSPILFYDPINRLVATLRANHTYEKIVFDPWWQQTWDVNDTVLQDDPRDDPAVGSFFARLPDSEYLPTWRTQRATGDMGADEQTAATRASFHAGTPDSVFLDSMGRVFLAVSHNRFERNGAMIDETPATRFALDVQGNQRSITDAFGRTSRSYFYGFLGLRIRQESIDGGARWIMNDVRGKPLRLWDSRDHQIRHEYDGLSRPTNLFVQTGSSQERLAERIIYGEGQPDELLLNLRTRAFKQFDGAGVLTNNEYDFAGNLISNTRQLLADYKAEPDWSQAPELEDETYTSETVYDALSRPLQVTTPDASVIRHVFNTANMLEQLSVKLRGAVPPAVFISNLDYNARGQREVIEYGNATRTSYSYDPATFRLVSLKSMRSTDGVMLQDLTFTYDPVGNIVIIRDAAQQNVYFNNQVVSADNDYNYDSLYRLIGAGGREHAGQAAQPQNDWDDHFRTNLPQPNDGQAMRNYQESYEYDLAGNILKVAHSAANGSWTRRYDYDEPKVSPANNHLTSTTIGAIKEQYAYDSHGNITQMPHLPSMEWDFKDQLHATQRQVVNNGSAEKTYYVYNAAGQRVRKITDRPNGSKKQENIYLSAFELYREYNGGGGVTLERETLSVMDHQQRAALIETKTIDTTQPAVALPSTLQRYQYCNHLGSAALELDEAGSVISYEEYYPYGGTSYEAVRNTTEVSPKRYRYTDKERDQQTGFYYHGARYYAAWLGRWVSCDPGGLRDGVNLYSYTRNNPIVFYDPNGQESTPPDNSAYFEDITPAIVSILNKNNIGLDKAVYLVTQAYSEQGPSAGLPSKKDNRIFNHHGTDDDIAERFGKDKVADVKKQLSEKDESGRNKAVDFGNGVRLRNISQSESTDPNKPDMRTSATYVYDTLEASVSHHLTLLEKRFGSAFNVLKDSKGTFEQYAHALKSYGHKPNEKQLKEREAKEKAGEKITDEKLMFYDEVLIQKRFSQVHKEFRAWVLYTNKNLAAQVTSDKNYVAQLQTDLNNLEAEYAAKYEKFQKKGEGADELNQLAGRRDAISEDLRISSERLNKLLAIQKDIKALAKTFK